MRTFVRLRIEHAGNMKERLNIPGPSGKLAATLCRPELLPGRKCPLVILMHGFMANQRMEPLKGIARVLEQAGIATLRFDFDGHGRSDGRFCDMTVRTELADAQAVYAYAAGLDFVGKIAFLGHSQGGVVAGMTAAELGADKVACLVQLAPAAVLRDDAIAGVLMGKHYDPADPPAFLRVFFHKVGRNYFTVAQTLPIFETSAAYTGPVCLVHGKEDKIVPFSYSQRYHEIYRNSELHLLDGENHILSRRRKEVTALSTDFLIRHLLTPDE